MAAIDDVFLSQVTLFKEHEEGGSPEEVDDFDLSFLVEMTLVETVDVSGPRLMLQMDDFPRYLRDELEAQPRDLLRVTFSSNWFEGDGDELDIVIWFRIMTMPQQGDSILFNCIEKELELIKQPSKKAILFTGKPVSAIIGRLLPKFKQEIGKFPVQMDYHVLPGMRPAKTLRQMCREMRAACFNRRGTVVFKTWEELLKQEPALTYWHNDPAGEECDEEIQSYELLRVQGVVKDRVSRNYMSWNLTDGLVTTGRALKQSAEWAAPAVSSVLDNLLSAPAPTIDLITSGQGDIRPGIVMELIWQTDNPEKPIDESLPAKVLVATVAHYYSGSNYMCRVKGIQVEEPPPVQVPEAAAAAVTKVAAAATTAAATAATAATAALAPVTSVVSSVTSDLNTAVATITGAVAAATSAVTGAANAVLAAARAEAATVLSDAQAALDEITGVSAIVDSAQLVVDGALSTVTDLKAGVESTIAGATGAINTATSGALKAATDAVTAPLQAAAGTHIAAIASATAANVAAMPSIVVAQAAKASMDTVNGAVSSATAHVANATNQVTAVSAAATSVSNSLAAAQAAVTRLGG